MCKSSTIPPLIWLSCLLVLDYNRMKQCPNPNCILYTRLEELPDAYTKCPGCGGQLVDASMSSGALHSGYLSKPPGSGLAQRDLDQEFEEAFHEELPPFLPSQDVQAP